VQVALVAQGGASVVAHAHQAKLMKYEAQCQAEGIAFLPVAVDTFGGWHREGLATLTKLGRQLARAVGKAEEEVVKHLWQRLAVLLVRDIVAMLSSRAPAFPPSKVDGEAD